MNKPKSKIAWLWENMRGYRIIYFFSIIGTIAYNAMQLVVPYITAKIVDTFLTGENAAENINTQRDLFYQLIIAMVVPTLAYPYSHGKVNHLPTIGGVPCRH